MPIKFKLTALHKNQCDPVLNYTSKYDKQETSEEWDNIVIH